jgi:hypothetical protein
MRTRFWLAGVVVAVGLGLTAAADSDIHTAVEAAPVSSADSLVLAVDLWYQATLAGDESQTNTCEQKIFRLLSIDMERTQGRLFKMIEQAKTEQNDTNASFAKIDSVPGSLQDSIEFLRSTLSVKRILSNAISKSEAFSNKYRLLGDYVELIRRDVGLPKLKLASEKKLEAQKN